jgi:hypothetical protein
MPTSSSNIGTNHSDPESVENNAQSNDNGEAAIRNEQRRISTNTADSTPATAHGNDVQDDPVESETRNLDYLRYFYDEP